MTTATRRRLRWIKEPRQDRSRAKLQRMLDATEALLETKPFDEIGIQDIMKRAGASVGLFYTRFPDKEALLAALYDRHMRELTSTGDELLDPKRWNDVTLEAFIREFVAFAVAFHRRRRGLLRTLVLRSHANPEKRYAAEEVRRGSMLARVAAIVASKKDEVTHPEPHRAGALGYLMVLGAIREKILFQDGVARAVACSDRRLAEQLATAYLAYLGTGTIRKRPTARTRKGGRR